MKLAKVVFTIAGVYGLAVLLPQYLMEEKTGRDFPPAITHPEYFYGFIGVAVAWQIAFFVIASDPVRYRLMMLPAIVEKASFGVATVLLFIFERVNTTMFAAALIDLTLGLLFLASFKMTSDVQDS